MANGQRTRRRVTIKDIARTARVDPSTVTRALQGSERVKQSTREHITRLAREMGYVPSVAARMLVTRRSRLVGVVLPDMTNPFFAELLRGVEDEAERQDLRILLRSTEGRQAAERDAVKLFIELNVDGVLVPMARCPQSFYDELEGGVPIIHVNRDDARHHVSCNTIRGSELLMAHLLGLGHRRIAFVNGPAGPGREPKRHAYRAALEQAGIAYDDSLVFEFDGTLASTHRIADALLSREPRPTAVFAWNDVCAIGLIQALTERGVAVPSGMSVAGHDDIDLAGHVLPAITTVRWPMHEIGEAAVRYLSSLEDGEQPLPPGISEPQLLVRSSTGPAPDG